MENMVAEQPVRIKKSDLTKLRIIKAAEELFVEEGFEGARVDKIAIKGRINKALIYYYFGSKENLLAEIIKRNLITEKRMAAINEFIDMMVRLDREGMKKFIKYQIEEWDKQKGLISVLVIESLKISMTNNSIFEMFSESGTRLIDEMVKAGFKVSDPADRTDFMLKFLYFIFAPAVIFSLIGEKWAELYGMDRSIMREKYSEMMLNELMHLLEEKTLVGSS
jgi:AcrR family transcriptional regulator